MTGRFNALTESWPFLALYGCPPLRAFTEVRHHVQEESIEITFLQIKSPRRTKRHFCVKSANESPEPPTVEYESTTCSFN